MEIIESNSQASIEGENQSIGLEQNTPDIQIETQSSEIPVELPQRTSVSGGKVKDVLVNGESVLDEEGNANIEIPEPVEPVEYKADDNIIIKDKTIKGYTDTGYEVIDEEIELQNITPSGTTGTNKILYVDDKEISVIYDGSNKIRRSKNGIKFDLTALPYTCKSMFYNPENNRFFGLANNGYFIYSDDYGETWNTKQSTYANNIDYIARGEPHITGLKAINKNTKTIYSLDANFKQTNYIRSSISPDFTTQFEQYKFIWCNSSGTFKYAAGSSEGVFASLPSGVTVNMLKTVNGRQIVGLKNNNKIYIIKNLTGVSGNEWIPYTLPDVCTVNDVIFNPYDKTYYIFTDINTYCKTKDFINYDNVDNGLRGIQGYFTLKGIQMTTVDHDTILLAPTRTMIEDKLQEHDRGLNKSLWIGKGLKEDEEGKVNVISNSDIIGVSSNGISLGLIPMGNLTEDIIECLYVAKAKTICKSPLEIEDWYWNEGYPEDDVYACIKFRFTEAGSFIDMVTWEDEIFVEEGEIGYLFYDQNMTIFKYVKLFNINDLK